MDFIVKLFARCMALAVVATPLCVFASVDVQQAERPLQDVKFDFTKPAEDFKQAIDKKVEQEKVSKTKKAAGKRFKGPLAGIFKALGLLCVVAALGYVTFWGLLWAACSIGSDAMVIGLVFYALPLSILVVPVLAFYYFGASIKNDLIGEDEIVSEPTFRSKS